MSELIDFKPEDISDTPIESLLSSLNLGVMRDNITQQIKGTITSQQNFLGITIEKFNIIEENCEDPDVKREIQYEIIDFCRDLVMEFVERYSLFYDDDQGKTKQPIHVLSILYNFFILRGKELVTTFFINYIENNKTHLVNSLRDKEDEPKIKDITTISNEKKNISGDTLWIASHIDSVINFICSVGVTPEEFIQTVNDGDFYVEKLNEYFLGGTIGGNFTDEFIDNFINDSNSEYAMEIRNDIRLEILKMTGRI